MSTQKKYWYPKYIQELSQTGIVLGMESMRRLLDQLKHPEEELKIIHVAGTNGKGSTVAFLSSIIMEAGYTVGRYISPTIFAYEERFQINSEMISKEELEVYFKIMKRAVDKIEEMGYAPPTIFEVETALAFLYFKENKVDYVLLETGMGGAEDATNAIKHPLFSIITSVSYDHMKFLGNTLEKIALQKAGIMKEGVSLVLADNPLCVQRVIWDQAKRKNSPCFTVEKDDYSILESDYKSSLFVWNGREYKINLPGDHQVSNAVTALTAARLLLEISEEDCQKGLANTVWPGRLEILSTNPIFIRDGAHNEDAAIKLANYIEKHFTNRKIIYIMGVLRDKEYDKMLKALLPLGDMIYTFQPGNVRGLSGDDLAQAVRSCRKEITVLPCIDVKDALEKAFENREEESIYILCGSLSFMEEMKELR